MHNHSLGIVGATGAVGLKLLQVIDERVKNVKNLRLFASQKSAGKEIVFRGHKYKVEALKSADFSNLDVVFFSAGTTVSREYADKAVKDGCLVIDNSNAHRMFPEVPLIVPEINFSSAKKHQGIIANPNCSTIQLVAAIGPIHKINPIKRIVVSTYQSVSGTGLRAMEILKAQSRAMIDEKEEIPQGVYPHPIAFNLIPQIDVLLESGMYREEEKMVRETQKILDDNICICPTCVRVPVVSCHCESVNIELSNSMKLNELIKTLEQAEDVIVMDKPSESIYPTPLNCQDRDEIFVGRIRKDFSCANAFNMWITADNLRRGAATNAVKIYTKMAENNLIKEKS
jgi:aspartate-semialdehyde dehydrogenase